MKRFVVVLLLLCTATTVYANVVRHRRRLVAGAVGSAAAPVCGDAICNGAETTATCCTDCGVAIDGVCNCTETPETACADCGSSCGDLTCNCTETTVNCCTDCGAVCGDGTCNCGEDWEICNAECGPFVDTNSVAFDGTNELGTVTDTANWNFASLHWSECFWMKVNTLTTSRVLSGKYDGTTLEWMLQSDSSNSRFVVQAGTTSRFCRHTSNTIVTGAWHHYCLVMDLDQSGACTPAVTCVTANQTHFYKDGALSDWNSCSGGGVPGSLNMTYTDRNIAFNLNGRVGCGSACGLDAKYDQVAIWTKVLSAGEVTTIYNSGNRSTDYKVTGPTSNLKFWWSLGDYSDGTGGTGGGHDAMHDWKTGETMTLNNSEAGDVQSDVP